MSCQLKEPTKSHGIMFLENRSNQLSLNKTNKNDVVTKIGQPHSLSTFNENEWIYFERVLTKGEFLKLGTNVLKTNNVLILKFNKYGILEKKTYIVNLPLCSIKSIKPKKTILNFHKKKPSTTYLREVLLKVS